MADVLADVATRRTGSYHWQMLRTSAVVVALLLLPGFAGAAKRGKGGGARKVVALFLVSRGNPDPGITRELASQLLEIAPDVRIVAHQALKKVLGKKIPDAAINECDGGAPCLARLGQRVGASEVLYGTLSPAGSGVEARFLIVDVVGARVARRTSFDLSSADAVGAAVAAQRVELFGAPPTAELPLEVVLGESAVGDGPETGDELGELDLAVIPRVDSDDAGSSAVATDGGPPPSQAGSLRGLTWAGAGCAGVGLVALGVGGYYGATFEAGPESIARGPGGTTFTRAVELYDESDRKRRRANLFLIGGGALTAVGVALVGLDLFVWTEEEQTAAVTVGGTGNEAWVRFAW